MSNRIQIYFIVMCLWVAGCAPFQRGAIKPQKDAKPQLKESTVKPPKDELDQRVSVSEERSVIRATATTPFPPEISDQTQSQALSREAAIALGQSKILETILKKRTKKGKELSEAEIPYVDLQDDIRGYVKGVKIERTTWDDNGCTVELALDKSHLKEILSKN